MARMRKWVLVALFGVAVLATPAVAEPPQNFVLCDTPAPVPELRFAYEAGKPLTLADFRGRVMLLNVWGTWCLACRTEMPTLDRLQAALDGPNFEVLTLSIDRRGPETVRQFYAHFRIGHLAIRVDTTNQVAFILSTAGLPTTLLFDRQGQELGCLVGPSRPILAGRGTHSTRGTTCHEYATCWSLRGVTRLTCRSPSSSAPTR